MFKFLQLRYFGVLLAVSIMLTLIVASPNTAASLENDNDFVSHSVQGTPGEITFIVGEEAIREHLDQLGMNLDELIEESKTDSSSLEISPPPEQPEGAGGHQGVFIPLCRGPQTAYHLFQSSTGPWGVVFSGTSIWANGVTCNALQCTILAQTYIPSGEVAITYSVTGFGFTNDWGTWCS